MEDDRLFGTYVRMHRIRQNIKLEVMADQVKLNKGKLSKLETGSMPWSDEDKKNVLSYLKVQFHEGFHRKSLQNKVLEIYEMYAKLDRKKLKHNIKNIIDNTQLKDSKCFMDYCLVQYMCQLLVCKDISHIASLKHKIQKLVPYFSKIERLIYYDMQGLELYYKQQYEEAVEYFEKVAKARHESLSMMGYAHLNLVYSKLGNYQKAIHCINKAITDAISTVSLKRLTYFIYHKANTYVHGLYIEEAKELYCQLLKETLYIEKELCRYIHQNLAYLYLFEKDFESCIIHTKKAFQQGLFDLDMYLYITYSYYMLQDNESFFICLSKGVHKCADSEFHLTFLESLWFLYTEQNEYAITFMKDCVTMSNLYPLDERIWILDVLKQCAGIVKDAELVHQCTEQLLDLYRRN